MWTSLLRIKTQGCVYSGVTPPNPLLYKDSLGHQQKSHLAEIFTLCHLHFKIHNKALAWRALLPRLNATADKSRRVIRMEIDARPCWWQSLIGIALYHHLHPCKFLQNDSAAQSVDHVLYKWASHLNSTYPSLPHKSRLRNSMQAGFLLAPTITAFVEMRFASLRPVS